MILNLHIALIECINIIWCILPVLCKTGPPLHHVVLYIQVRFVGCTLAQILPWVEQVVHVRTVKHSCKVVLGDEGWHGCPRAVVGEHVRVCYIGQGTDQLERETRKLLNKNLLEYKKPKLLRSKINWPQNITNFHV